MFYLPWGRYMLDERFAVRHVPAPWPGAFHEHMQSNKEPEHKDLVRGISGDSVRIFLIKLFGNLATLVAMVHFSHGLAPSQYGQYQNFWVYFTMSTTLGSLGITLLLFTYTPDRIRSLLSVLRPSHFIAYGGILLLLGALFCYLLTKANGMDAHSWPIPLSYFLLYIVSVLLEALLLALKRYRGLILTSVLYAASYVGVCLAINAQGFSITGLLGGLLPILAIKVAIMGALAFRSRTRTVPGPSSNELRQTKSLWAHLGFYEMTNMLFLWLDKFIVSLLVSAELSATYFNGAVAIPFIPIALSAVGSATLMQLARAGQVPEKVALLRHSGRVLSCIAFPAFFFLLVFRRAFIETVFSEKYLASMPIFVCALLILPLRAFNHTTVLQNYHQGKIINYGALLDFGIALALVYPLYRVLGLAGIALSFTVSTYFQSFYYLYHSSRLLGVPIGQQLPLGNWGGKLLAYGALSALLYFLVAGQSPAIRLVVGGSVMAAVALLHLRYEMKGRLGPVQG